MKNRAIVFLGLLFSLFLSYPFTVPQNVPAPSRVRGINGYSIEVTWDKPVEVKGVIEKYILKAAEEDGFTVSTVGIEIANTTAFAGTCP